MSFSGIKRGFTPKRRPEKSSSTGDHIHVTLLLLRIPGKPQAILLKERYRLLGVHRHSNCNDANAVINMLKQDFSKRFKLFYENFMILNLDKCYFLTLGFQDAQPNCSYNNLTIKNVSEEKILGIAIDNKLTFKSNLKNIC